MSISYNIIYTFFYKKSVNKKLNNKNVCNISIDSIVSYNNREIKETG